jgi:hypothetical protein
VRLLRATQANFGGTVTTRQICSAQILVITVAIFLLLEGENRVTKRP